MSICLIKERRFFLNEGKNSSTNIFTEAIALEEIVGMHKDHT